MTLFIEASNADDKVAHLWRDLDLLKTYKAIDSVATGRIPSLFCAYSHLSMHVNTKLAATRFRLALSLITSKYIITKNLGVNKKNKTIISA